MNGELADKQRELFVKLQEYQRLRGEGKDTRKITTELIDLYHSMIAILTSKKPQTQEVVNLRKEYTGKVQTLEQQYIRPSTEFFPGNSLYLIIGLCIAITLLIILLFQPSSITEMPASTATMSPFTTTGV